ncbi:hypothetical protein QVD17_25121 [Tagetes erecta]|uniref:Uncharacterized protein n=1 Tax=Tagetes erecta TaxID=13708 RepID=A0AAD8NUW2_TARER|nr:hypothetical protein QVD17_25121 [Tagetes erecta]
MSFIFKLESNAFQVLRKQGVNEMVRYDTIRLACERAVPDVSALETWLNVLFNLLGIFLCAPDQVVGCSPHQSHVIVLFLLLDVNKPFDGVGNLFAATPHTHHHHQSPPFTISDDHRLNSIQPKTTTTTTSNQTHTSIG